MSSFKQKLKYLLNDSCSFRQPLNNDKKFDQIIMKTYRKIKKDNNRQSIVLSTYKSPKNGETKTRINYCSKIDSFCSNTKKRNATKNIENLIQTLALFKNKNKSFCKNNTMISPINKILKNPSNIQQKILKDIDSFKNDNSCSKHKYMFCNRPKTFFYKKKINTNIINKTVFNLKKVKNNNSLLFTGKSKGKTKDENVNIFEYYNRINIEQKKNDVKCSRNKEQYSLNFLVKKKKKYFNY